MNYRRHAARIFGVLILAVFSLAAFTAGAHAEKPEWLILNPPPQELFTLEELSGKETITGSQEGLGRLLILKLNLLLKCEDIKVINTHLLPAGVALGEVLFDDCYATDLTLAKAKCEFIHFVAQFKASIIEHNGASYVLFVPQDGLTFATVATTGGECPFPEEAELKGSFVAKVTNEGTHAVEKLLSTKSLLELFPSDALKYGTHTSHLEADASVGLSGTHVERPWGFHGP